MRTLLFVTIICSAPLSYAIAQVSMTEITLTDPKTVVTSKGNKI